MQNKLSCSPFIHSGPDVAQLVEPEMFHSLSFLSSFLSLNFPSSAFFVCLFKQVGAGAWESILGMCTNIVLTFIFFYCLTLCVWVGADTTTALCFDFTGLRDPSSVEQLPLGYYPPDLSLHWVAWPVIVTVIIMNLNKKENLSWCWGVSVLEFLV